MPIYLAGACGANIAISRKVRDLAEVALIRNRYHLEDREYSPAPG